VNSIQPEDAASQPAGQKPAALGVMNFLMDILETLILAVVLFVGINAVSARIRVDGASMEPTMHHNELVVVNRLGYRFGLPERGDVIVFHFPRDPEQEYIKRVIGLPGDRIAIANGVVMVNEHPLDEPYISAPPRYTGDWTVPADYLFVLGDNRNLSSDSHEWGMLPLDYVIGKAIFIYWPLSEMGTIAHVSLATPIP